MTTTPTAVTDIKTVRKAPAKKATTLKAPTVKAPVKKAPIAKVPVVKAEPTAEQTTVRASLTGIPAKRQAVATEERQLVTEGRKLGLSWTDLANDLGMSAMGLRNRYIDLVDAK